MKRNHSNEHPEDAVLLAYLDGELSRRATRTTAQHLQNCWTCRSSLAELELQAQIVSRLLSNHDESDIVRKQNAKARFLERKKHLETDVPPTICSLLQSFINAAKLSQSLCLTKISSG